jgi:glycosyltransferase involved in cell wall biosynthesis
MKKVIHIVECLERGGLEKVVGDIALHLDSSKFTIEIWGISRGVALADELEGTGSTVRVFDIHSYYNPLAFLKMINLFKEHKPDIIHTHIYFVNTLCRVAAHFARVPVVISHVHSTYTYYKWRHHKINKFLAKWTDKIVCCSNAVKEYVSISDQIPESKLVTIYNGTAIQPPKEELSKNLLILWCRHL